MAESSGSTSSRSEAQESGERDSRASGRPVAARTSAWDRFWFGEASLVRLAAFRIVMLAVALYANYQYRMGVFQHADELDPRYLARSWNPIYAFDVLGVAPMGPITARVVFGALIAAIAMGILGLYTRVACAVAAVLTFVWIGTNYSFGKPHHDCVALMIGLAALPFAPVGARLSLDSLIARVRRARRGEDPLAVPERAPWGALPWRLTQITVAIGYFFAGSSKIAIGGLGWANGYTLQGTMLEFNAPWTATFTHSVVLCALMSVGLLVVQASFPLVFLSEKLRWFYVPMASLFHLLSWKTMSTGPYLTLWFTMACFVRLERVPAFVFARLTEGRLATRVLWAIATAGAAWLVAGLYFARFPAWLALVLVPLAIAVILGCSPRLSLDVVYDGGCGVCKTTVAWLASLDWSRRLAFVDLNRWDEVSARHRELDAEACRRDMHAIDRAGLVARGYDAYRAIAWRLPLCVPIAPFLSLPGIRQAGAILYRRVADRRWKSSCGIANGPHTPRAGARITRA